MDLKKLLGLRPKEQTVASIREAILAAGTNKDAATMRVAELEAGRGVLLLQGEPKAIEAAERELIEARAEIERCEVMAQAMAAPLEAAEMAERVTAIKALIEEAERQTAAFVKWWRTEYAPLANKMRTGPMMERQAMQSIERLHTIMHHEPEAFVAAGGHIPDLPAAVIYPGDPANSVVGVTAGLRLPPPEGKVWPSGDAKPFWPPEREA